MTKIKLGLLILCGILFLSSCSSDDDDPQPTAPGSVETVEFLDVKSYTEWVYFSFEKKSVVTVTDFANDLNWDIAFHRGDVRLNGGKSGKGKGAVVQTAYKNWNDVKEAPKSGYVNDEIGTITTAFTGQGITTEDQPFSQLLSGWLTVDTSNPPPKYTINEHIYVVKSAKGNYVKLSLYDNKNEKNAAGYVSFKYQHNDNGVTDF